MLFFVVMLLFPHNSICVANLKYFETLSHVGVTSSIKRSSDGARDLMKHVRFRAFDRDFDLTLKSGIHLMAEGFRARLVHEDGSSSYFDIDQSQIFSGHLTDKPDVKVHAHTEDTLWSIQIFDNDDIYAVEPAWRLVNISENPKNDTMIAYRASDFSSDSFNRSRFCGVEDQEETATPPQHAKTRSSPSDVGQVLHSSNGRKQGNGTRGKRTINNAACVLFLVGDYTFYKGKCAGNHVICSTLMMSFSIPAVLYVDCLSVLRNKKTMVVTKNQTHVLKFTLVNVADALYRSSIFEDTDFDKYTDIGLVVGQIILFSTYTLPVKDDYKGVHFNENVEWSIDKKLNAFAYYSSYMAQGREYCINHLFTDYPFENQILGFAWLSTICSDSRPGYLQRNSGITSGTSNVIGSISTVQMNLVFAHGHNFGSEHDPATEECSKSDNEGGHFLMWSRSVSGQLPNHFKFSACSLKHIGRTLETADCLTPRALITSFCGNGVVEKGEECDAGALAMISPDNCCTKECSLKEGAICCDMNHACCKNCSMSPAGTACLSRNPTECREASYCTGSSFTCPEAPYMADWTNCRYNEHCYHGICRSFCTSKSIREGLNLKGCLCQTNENNDACKWCCFNATKGDNPAPCLVYSNETVRDGTPCYLGSCRAGICESNTVSSVQRLYRYLYSQNVSELVKFMRNNIVLCIIVSSLFLWLPPVYFMKKADKCERKRVKQIVKIQKPVRKRIHFHSDTLSGETEV